MTTTFDPEGHTRCILAAIVDGSDDAIIGKDLNGIILTWNRAAERLYGYRADEVIGRSIALLIPENQPAELAEILAHIRGGERVRHRETVRRTKDGRLVAVSVTVTPIADATGRTVGAATIARDVTDRNEGRSSEARWRSVIESAVDGIIVIDASGRIEVFNRAAERLFGYAEADVLGRNVNMLMPAPYHEEHDAYITRYMTTGCRRIIGIGREVKGLRRDGTTFPVHLAVGEMTVGGERKFTGILHDLSDRVAMEQQVREQAALARLGEMAAVIAHEVKNPLAGVRGAIQVIAGRMPAGTRDATVAQEIIARIDGLNALMKDLLLFARPPQPNPAPVDLTNLVSTTVELLSRDPALAGVQVTVEGSAPPVMADPELLKIVLVNLLVNSAHAMKGSGNIRVSVSSRARKCDIVVQDSGPGIPVEIREKIFTPFFTTKARGSGLGLSTAKRLIEAHSGSIRVDCPPTGGTTVTIQLPSS